MHRNTKIHLFTILRGISTSSSRKAVVVRSRYG